MEVVENGVFDARIDQVAGERLLPHPFGHPHAADGRPQAVLQPAAVAADLADAVAAGDHRQDRLVERAADDLDPPLARKLGQAIDVFGMGRVEPFHQRTAGVQGDPQGLVTAENIEERPIAVLVGLLEDVVEVTDGLMIVQGKDQADGVGHDSGVVVRWIGFQGRDRGRVGRGTSPTIFRFRRVVVGLVPRPALGESPRWE